MNRPIFVTQPLLPPLDDFLPLLRQIWDSRVLTNGGPFHQKFDCAEALAKAVSGTELRAAHIVIRRLALLRL